MQHSYSSLVEGSSMIGGQIILHEDYDENYNPSEQELREYCDLIGIDFDKEQDLLWIAKEGVKAPLPEEWKPCKDSSTEEVYYFNFTTGDTQWDDPRDVYYRKMADDERAKNTAKAQTGHAKKSDGKKMRSSSSKKKRDTSGKKKPDLIPSSTLKPLRAPPPPSGPLEPIVIEEKRPEDSGHSRFLKKSKLGEKEASPRTGTDSTKSTARSSDAITPRRPDNDTKQPPHRILDLHALDVGNLEYEEESEERESINLGDTFDLNVKMDIDALEPVSPIADDSLPEVIERKTPSPPLGGDGSRFLKKNKQPKLASLPHSRDQEKSTNNIRSDLTSKASVSLGFQDNNNAFPARAHPFTNGDFHVESDSSLRHNSESMVEDEPRMKAALAAEKRMNKSSLDNEKQDISASNAKELEALKKRLQKELEDSKLELFEDKDERLKRLKANVDIEIEHEESKMAKDREQRIRELQVEVREELERERMFLQRGKTSSLKEIKENIDEEVKADEKALKDESKRRMDDLKKEVELLEQEELNGLEEKKRVLSRTIEETKDIIDENRKEVEKGFEEEIGMLRAQHQEQLSAIQADHEQKLSEHQLALEALRADHEQQLNQEKEMLIAKLKLESQSALEEARGEHERTMETLRSDNDKEQKKIKEELRIEDEKLRGERTEVEEEIMKLSAQRRQVEYDRQQLEVKERELVERRGMLEIPGEEGREFANELVQTESIDKLVHSDKSSQTLTEIKIQISDGIAQTDLGFELKDKHVQTDTVEIKSDNSLEKETTARSAQTVPIADSKDRKVSTCQQHCQTESLHSKADVLVQVREDEIADLKHRLQKMEATTKIVTAEREQLANELKDLNNVKDRLTRTVANGISSYSRKLDETKANLHSSTDSKQSADLPGISSALPNGINGVQLPASEGSGHTKRKLPRYDNFLDDESDVSDVGDHGVYPENDSAHYLDNYTIRMAKEFLNRSSLVKDSESVSDLTPEALSVLKQMRSQIRSNALRSFTNFKKTRAPAPRNGHVHLDMDAGGVSDDESSIALSPTGRRFQSLSDTESYTSEKPRKRRTRKHKGTSAPSSARHAETSDAFDERDRRLENLTAEIRDLERTISSQVAQVLSKPSPGTKVVQPIVIENGRVPPSTNHISDFAYGSSTFRGSALSKEQPISKWGRYLPDQRLSSRRSPGLSPKITYNQTTEELLSRNRNWLRKYHMTSHPTSNGHDLLVKSDHTRRSTDFKNQLHIIPSREQASSFSSQDIVRDKEVVSSTPLHTSVVSAPAQTRVVPQFILNSDDSLEVIKLNMPHSK